MLSSLCHSGLSSAPLPQSVSAEGSQIVSTMGASTVSSSGEVQRGVAAGSERPAVFVVVTIIICDCTTIVLYSESIIYNELTM